MIKKNIQKLYNHGQKIGPRWTSTRFEKTWQLIETDVRSENRRLWVVLINQEIS